MLANSLNIVRYYCTFKDFGQTPGFMPNRQLYVLFYDSENIKDLGIVASVLKKKNNKQQQNMSS